MPHIESPRQSYRNPIVPGFNPDPSMIRVGNDYFLVTSSFEYFPGLPIYHSMDLVSWKLINHACTRRSQLDLRTVEAGGGLFAPTIREHDGRIFVACCQMQKSDSLGGYKKMVVPRGFFVSAAVEDIFKQDSFSEPVWLDNAGIDQDLYWDKDGKLWISTADFITDPKILKDKTGHPIVVVTRQVNPITGRSLTHDVVNCWSSVGNGVAEGPHIFERNGWLYLNVAIGGTEICHQQWIYRTKGGPLGPWEVGPKGINPMVFNNDHPEVQLTGHMDLCRGATDDKWWAVFLAVRPQQAEDGGLQNSQLGRETFLAPVEWKDDWPIVNKGKPITINGLPEAGLERLPQQFEEHLDFDSDVLPLGWYHARTPLKQHYDLSLQPGRLALYGNCYRFKDDECLSMLLRKQTALGGEWRVNVEFEPALVAEEAGTTVWWSKHCYASVGIRGLGDEENPEGSVRSKAVVFRFPDPSLPEEDVFQEISIPWTAKTLQVKIACHSLQYDFYIRQDADKDWHQVGSMKAKVLTRTRVYDSFCTGTMIGIYALGSPNRPCLQPALFDGVVWKGVRGGGP